MSADEVATNSNENEEGQRLVASSSPIINNVESTSSNSTSTSHHSTYGSFVAFCFGVNYILGVGVLGVPNAFQAGGLLVGPLALFIVSVIAVLAYLWIAEALSRAEAVTAYKDLSAAKASSPKEKISYGTTVSLPFSGQETTLKEEEEKTFVHTQTDEVTEVTPKEVLQQFPNELPIITFRKFEINELVNIFMGKFGEICYGICVILYLYGGLLSYSSVFASSLASHIPLPMIHTTASAVGSNSTVTSLTWFTCNIYTDPSFECTVTYWVYIGLFALIAIPLSCLNLTEQKVLQIVLAIFRFFALGLMITLIVFAIFFDPYSRFPTKPPEINFDTQHAPFFSQFSLVDWVGLYKLLPTCIYSQILHHSIPGLAQPVKDKKSLSKIFSAVFFSTFTFYTFLGVTLSLYFGQFTQPTVTLNFSWFRGGASFDQPVPFWITILIYIIILFPPLDILSAYPLNAITLGNNLHAGVFAKYPRLMQMRAIQIVFRIIAAVPPLILSLFLRDLSVILSYVGLLGFVITFIFPAVLQIVSKWKMKKLLGHSKTYYSIPVISSDVFCYTVIIATSVSILYCLVTNILANVGVLK